MPEEKREEERITMAKPCTEWRRLKQRDGFPLFLTDEESSETTQKVGGW